MFQSDTRGSVYSSRKTVPGSTRVARDRHAGTKPKMRPVASASAKVKPSTAGSIAIRVVSAGAPALARERSENETPLTVLGLEPTV